MKKKTTGISKVTYMSLGLSALVVCEMLFMGSSYNSNVTVMDWVLFATSIANFFLGFVVLRDFLDHKKVYMLIVAVLALLCIIPTVIIFILFFAIIPALKSMNYQSF